MKIKTFAAAAFLVAVMLVMGGCAKSASVQVPGSINTVDSNAFQTLTLAQAAIKTFHDPVAASNNATLIKIYDAFVTAYNTAQPLYAAYHTALAAGTVTAQQTAAMQQAVASVTTAQAQLPPTPPATTTVAPK